MRIGIMLRSIDEKGGIGVYTHNIVRELLSLDRENSYNLYYRTPTHMGEFTHYVNVTERLVRGKYKPIWDQVAVPLACWRDKLDVVFHPKFTTPLLAPCKAVMVVHGADYFIPDHAQYYNPIDVKYAKIMMPVYFRKAATVISVSQITTDNFYQALDLSPGKVKTIYFAPARHFRPVSNSITLGQVKDRYQLPERFILTLSKPDGDGRKNLGQIFKSYARYHEQMTTPAKLVIGGKDCHRFRDEYRLPGDGYGRDIIFTGYIDQADLPAVYSQASLYLYPSNLEAFPIPITEAMACGTPIVTSDANGLREIAGDAALLVEPSDTEAIAQAICRVLTDSQLSSTLSAKGLRRSKLFTWDECARETLAVLEGAVA